MSPLVTATDASSHRAAQVSACIPLEQAVWLNARASRRGAYTQLTRDVLTDTGDLVPADPLLHEWLVGTQFAEVWCYIFRRHRHISLLELQAHRTWAKRAGKDRRQW